MNILIVHPCKGFYGGAEDVVVKLTKYLRSVEIDTETVVKNPPKALEQQGAGVRRKSQDWTTFFSDVQHASKWNDVTLCFNFPATLATLGTKKPIVWYCNEPPELFTNWKRKPLEAFHRWYVRHAVAKCIVADEYNAKRFESIYKIKPEIVPYGIDYDFWSKGDVVPRDGGPWRLLQVGTISPYKNQKASIEALKYLRSKGVEATLTLVGSITDLDYYRSLLTDWQGHVGFNGRVKFLGQKTQEEVRELYHQHDVLLHPVKEQGGWLVPFEAICTHLPVIVTTNFPAADNLRQAGAPVALEEEFGPSLLNMLGHYNNYINRFLTTKQYVRDNLTWDSFGSSIVNILEEVI